MELNWYTVLFAGFIDSFNPCAITVLLLFIGLLFTMQKSRSQTLVIISSYILSLYITYLCIGLGLFKVMYIFGATNLISRIAAGILIIIALYGIAENTFKQVPHYLTIRPNQRQILNQWMNRASIPAAVIAGILVGLFEFPCSGAIYVTIVSLLAKDATYSQGIIYLLGYNVAFVSPLIILALITNNRITAEKIIYWQEKREKTFRLTLHTLLLILGIILLFFIK